MVTTMDVLLIEDNAADVKLAQEAFGRSKKPINLHVVGDGVEAMSFLRRNGAHVDAPRPHVILLDLNLPKMDGREVLTILKNDIDLKAIPTIILTSSDARADIEYCYQNAANCYIRKPEDWDSFNHVVRSINSLWFTLAKVPGNY
jgi:two-component system, chemotaxis family, response regulator Rcp1